VVSNQINVERFPTPLIFTESVVETVLGQNTTFHGMDVSPAHSGIDPTLTPNDINTIFYDISVESSGAQVPIVGRFKHRSVVVPEDSFSSPIRIPDFFTSLPGGAVIHVFQRSQGNGKIIYDLFATFALVGAIDLELTVANVNVPIVGDGVFPTDLFTNTAVNHVNVVNRHTAPPSTVYDVFLLD